MNTEPPTPRHAGPRDLLYFASPELWPRWPFLPLVRHGRGDFDCGVLCDLAGLRGTPDFRFTVFLCNLLLLPGSVAGWLALPKEEYHSAQEVAAAGWVVD